MDTRNAELVTRAHMQRVAELLNTAAVELLRRASAHDLSKLTPQELEPLQRMQDHIALHGQAPYGTPAYDAQTAMLRDMLAHHYANNSHHPEHYADGVAGMDLFDLMEMFFDWKAASERGGESAMNITASTQKHGLPPMLESILRNTAARLGYTAT